MPPEEKGGIEAGLEMILSDFKQDLVSKIGKNKKGNTFIEGAHMSEAVHICLLNPENECRPDSCFTPRKKAPQFSDALCEKQGGNKIIRHRVRPYFF